MARGNEAKHSYAFGCATGGVCNQLALCSISVSTGGTGRLAMGLAGIHSGMGMIGPLADVSMLMVWQMFVWWWLQVTRMRTAPSLTATPTWASLRRQRNSTTSACCGGAELPVRYHVLLCCA